MSPLMRPRPPDRTWTLPACEAGRSHRRVTRVVTGIRHRDQASNQGDSDTVGAHILVPRPAAPVPSIGSPRSGRPTCQGQSLQSVARVGRYRRATAPDRNSWRCTSSTGSAPETGPFSVLIPMFRPKRAHPCSAPPRITGATGFRRRLDHVRRGALIPRSGSGDRGIRGRPAASSQPSRKDRPTMPRPHRIAHRLLISVLAIVGLVVPLTGSGLADASPSHHSGPKPTIVLVHGDWADGSSWNAVIAKLQARGYTVVAPPNPFAARAMPRTWRPSSRRCPGRSCWSPTPTAGSSSPTRRPATPTSRRSSTSTRSSLTRVKSRAT